MQTRFTVIIPTRERADTLTHALHTVTTQNYENLQIIVSDNHSRDNTHEVVSSLQDPRLSYINTGKRVSMSANWEFALSHVTDGWVMFIGDDDGLLPGALQRLDLQIREHNVECIASKTCQFQWPGHFAEDPDGHLWIPLSGPTRMAHSRQVLRRVLAGSQSYNRLPWLYTGGAASIHLVNRLRDGNGRFFCSQVPDIYSAMALSLSTDVYMDVGTPFAVAGASRHSTGASAVTSTDTPTDPFARFIQEGNIPFHDTLESGKSLQIALYDCYLHALHIRSDSFNVSLEDQLRVALHVAPTRLLPDVEKQCRAIAAKNGISWPRHYSMILHRLRHFLPYARRVYSRIDLPARPIGIADVQDAATAASHILGFLEHSPDGIAYLLFRNFIKRVAAKVRTEVRIDRHGESSVD